MSAQGLLQGNSAVCGGLCVTSEGGFDFGTALFDGCGTRRVNGDDADQELAQIGEILAPEVVYATYLLERSALDGQTEDFLRGGANIGLILHRT